MYMLLTIGCERVFFLKKLQEAMNNIPRENVIIAAGNFYCTLNHTVDRNHDEPHLYSAASESNTFPFTRRCVERIIS